MTLEDKSIEIVKQYGPIVARILIGGMFLMAGIGKIFAFGATAGYIASVGLPLSGFMTFLAIIVEIAGGLSLILGYKVRIGADLLIIFTILATVLFHNNLADQTQMILFNKNLAIIGGLIYIMAYGAGPLSLESREKERSKFFKF